MENPNNVVKITHLMYWCSIRVVRDLRKTRKENSVVKIKEEVLELKFSFGFSPRLFASPNNVEAIVQRARFYDSWTFTQLINKLFYIFIRDNPINEFTEDQLGIEVSMISQGFSGASVFAIELISVEKSEPLDSNDNIYNEWCNSRASAYKINIGFIVKLGEYKALMGEVNCYNEHVLGTLNSSIYPKLIAHASFIDKTGAILYERITDMVSFFNYYIKSTEIPEIKKRINHLLSELTMAWYSYGVPKRLDLFSIYHLSDRKERFLLAIKELVPPEDIRRLEIDIPGPGNIVLGRGRNPLDILEDPYLGNLKVLVSLIHDDLNPYNIFVDTEVATSLKLIDFADTGHRPTLQDFAKLEMSILFLLYDRSRSREPWGLTNHFSSLCRSDIFQGWMVTAVFPIDRIYKQNPEKITAMDFENQKLMETIDVIRGSAQKFSYTDWILEYQIALLTWSLRATHWNDASPAKRLFAFYVSAILAKRIRERYSEIRDRL